MGILPACMYVNHMNSAYSEDRTRYQLPLNGACNPLYENLEEEQ